MWSKIHYTSPVQAEVSPKLAEADTEKSEEPTDLIWGPLSTSNTFIPKTAPGGTIYTRATDGEGMAGTEDGVGGGK